MYVKTFQEISKDAVAIAGGKGASLGEMTQAGIPVPEGFVITTDAFLAFSKSAIPESVHQELLQAFDTLQTERVAVRSSAVAEDSSTSSWAGLLESYLNITKEGLLEAIKKCWDSIQTERAISYAKEHKIPESQLMVAVVVQKMVDSEISGVMFTANPVTSNSNELMIEAGYGLGELLVQGEIIPDNYLVDKNSLKITSVSEGSQKIMLTYKNGTNQKVPTPPRLQGKQILTHEQIITVANLGRVIETHYHSPQDIEWTFEKGQFSIVQSRPITTLSPKLPTLPPPPKGVKYALTVPQSVLFADLSLQGNCRKYFKEAFTFDYEPHYIVIDAGGAMSWNYDSDDQFAKALIGKKSVTDAISQFIQTMERTGRNLDVTSLAINKAYKTSRKTQNLIDDLTTYWEAYKLHNTSLYTFWNTEYLLTTELIKMLKQAQMDDEITNGLIRFFKPYRQNYFVIERIALETIMRRFAISDKKKRLAFATMSPLLKKSLEKHARTFGFLLAPFNLGEPPSLESLIDRINEINKTENKSADLVLTKDLFADLPPQIRKLSRLTRQFAFWKTHRLDIFSLADSRVQNLYNLVARNLSLPKEQLFFMTNDEILGSLKKGTAMVNEQTIRERQKAYCLLLYKGHVDFYSPSVVGESSPSAQTDISQIKGVVASRGYAVGKVKIITSDADLKTFKRGDVLVTTMTRPEYGAALERAAAFITDEGGMISHAAIISRELNKPCIVGTKIATQMLKNGDIVEVNANNGTIMKL